MKSISLTEFQKLCNQSAWKFCISSTEFSECNEPYSWDMSFDRIVVGLCPNRVVFMNQYGTVCFKHVVSVSIEDNNMCDAVLHIDKNGFVMQVKILLIN